MVNNGIIIGIVIVCFIALLLYPDYNERINHLKEIAKNESCVNKGMEYFELAANPNYEFCKNGSVLFHVKFDCSKIYTGEYKCNFTEVDLDE